MTSKIPTTSKCFFAIILVLLFSCTVGRGQISITNTSAVTENFDGIGTSTTASLPANWKMSAAGAGSTAGWATVTNVTAVTQGSSTGSPTNGGRYNWGNGTTTTDRSIGFMTSGSYANPNSIMAYYQNNTGATITELAITFDYERYRINTAAANITFFTSMDGSSWTAQPTGDSGPFSTGTSSYTFSGGTIVSKSLSITSLSINSGAGFYLRWVFNTTGANSQGIGLDNLSVTATTGAISCSAPTTEASNITAIYTCANQLNLSWTNGNGSKRVVKMNTTNSFTNPTDGSDPAANSVYSGSGEQVVYNNNGNSASITGLSPSTTYWFRIYEYNCAGVNTLFFTSTGTNNPLSLATNTATCLSTNDYRTRQGGDWNNSASWQKWNGSTWVDCSGTDFPDNASYNVTIRNGHTIDNDGPGLNPNPAGIPWDVNNLTIEAGGKLWDNVFEGNNSYLHIYGNIVCNGTIGDPAGDDISFDIAGGANCTISGSGSFTATRIRKDDVINAASNSSLIFDMDVRLTWSQASGVVLFNDASATSNFNVTVNAGKTVRCFGPGSIACNVSIDGTNGNDVFDLGGLYTIFGTMDIDGALVSLNNNVSRATSVIVKNNGTLKCRYIQTGSSGAAGNTITVESGGRLNIFGSVDTVAATLNQTTWNNFSTTNNTWDFQPGSTIEYSGNTRQTINGITQCSNFTVSGGSIKTLGNTFRVDGILTLTNGLLTTSSTNLLTLSSTATCPSGGSFSSFVNGPMRKEGSAAFRFPVGKQAVNRTNLSGTGNVMNGGYRPISISGMTANSNFLAEYQLSNPYLQGSISPNAVGLQAISRCEYWDLVRESGTQTPTVTLTWSDNSVSGQSQCNVGPYIISPTSTFVVPFFNGMWGDQNSSFYGRTGSITTPASPLFLGEISWDGTTGAIDNYLKFVIGTNNWQQAPLPYDIKNFKATGKGKIVQLDWLINHNDEVRSYVIERSKDGIRFENMKMVPARANEEWAAYADTDPAPYNGWGYYRLRITDLSGRTSYSAIQKVWMGNAGTYVQVTPKPAKDRLWINLAEPEKINEMAIVSSVGQLLFKQNRFTNNNQIDISSLRPGVYYVRIVGQDGLIIEPFIKQ